MTMRFIQAKNYSVADRGPGSVTLVTIHTAECGETSEAAENVAAWGAGPNASKASWHYMVDNNSITQSVLEKDVAWHAGPVNGYSIGVEHAGRASQNASQWSDDYSIAMLERSAELVSDICRRHNIPVQRVTADDLRSGMRSGICGHVDVTMGLTGGKGHTDPGKDFPWDWYLERVHSHRDITPIEPPIAPPEVIATGIDVEGFITVNLNGTRWKVCPIYVAPIGIGEATDLAKSLGCELPSLALVDAIWRQSDLKVPPHLMVRAHDGTMRTMNSEEIHARQAKALADFVGERGLNRDYYLLGGAFKDVVIEGGKVGLYGWHADEEAVRSLTKIGVDTFVPATRGDGRIVQPFFTGHARSWKDYSQGLRLVRRAS